MTSTTPLIPPAVEDVSPEWLTAALRETGAISADARVINVRTEQIALDTGFSSLLYRLHLTGVDVPASVIVKLPAVSEARGAMEMLGGYLREVAFYQNIAGRAPIRTPRVHAARIDPDTSNFILVLEDLHHWDNADHLAGLSLRRARRAIAELAKLHSWSSEPANHDAVAPFASLDTEVTRQVLPSVFALGWGVYTQKTTQAVPDDIAAYADRFAELAPDALCALTERSMLIHGDIRADNMFFDGDDLKIVDFQLAARATGVVDVAYLVSQGLPTNLRSGRDEALLREYLDILSRSAIGDYGFAEAWRHYRFAVAYLVVLPVVILVGWDTLPQRSRDLCITLADRAVATMADIGAVEVFA